jgi:hypothetical protein
VLCELGYYFPRCTPALTAVVAQVLLNGASVGSGTAVFLEGRSVETQKDFPSGINLRNLSIPSHTIGCVGSPRSLQGLFAKGALVDVAVGGKWVYTLEGGTSGPPRVQRFSCP